MHRRLAVTCVGALVLAAFAVPRLAGATPISVYGAWHCGNDYCTWSTVRSITEFDQKNHWLIDRGDGRPSVNLVILSFVHPLRLLNRTNDSQTADGVPIGMTADVVNYFKSRNVRVMLSIGGITYVDAWNQALAADATQLGLNAADVATRLGVGIEIDYEESSSPNLAGLQAFIDAYRSVLPYDASGANPAARLTIDVAAGDRWLIALDRKATADWLNPASPVLDYANAMVPSRQPNSAATAESNWQEHVDGKPQYAPPIRRSLLRGSPAASSSPRARRRGPSATTSPSRCRARRARTSRRSRRRSGRRPACSATCSGRRSGPRRAA